MYKVSLLHTQINDSDCLRHSINELSKGGTRPYSHRNYENSYPKRTVGLKSDIKEFLVLTEFDGRAPCFSNAVPIINEPWSDPVIFKQICQSLVEMNREMNSTLEASMLSLTALNPMQLSLTVRN